MKGKSPKRYAAVQNLSSQTLEELKAKNSKMKERLLRVLTLVYTCKKGPAASILHFIQGMKIHYVN